MNAALVAPFPTLRCILPRLRAVLVLSSMLFAPAAFGESQAVSEMSRRDWYFRESLCAIRDWETVLARWESQTPEPERSPVFPVPSDETKVAWPNPVPLTLLPENDGKSSVRLSAGKDGKFQIERVAPGGGVVCEDSASNQLVSGYKHPGGGGKDQWYHKYSRKFDGLTAFRPELAPFWVRVDAPLDFRRGRNELPITLGNAGERSLRIVARLRRLTPAEDCLCAEQTVTLERGATGSIRFPAELESPGGGVLFLRLEAEGKVFWMPFLTHVENLPAVFESIGQILADTPDEAAATRLEVLRKRAGDPAAWRAVFEEASALREELLLRRLRFDALLFVKRKPYFSEQPFMDAHHCYNRPGGGIYRLSPVRPDGHVTTVIDSLGEGIYRDLCLDWDGSRFLFSFGNGADRGAPDGRVPHHYHIYEAGADGRNLRQLSQGPKNDCEPFYFPDGRIGFTSDRSEQYVMCGSNIHVANLFVMHADGSGLQQLGHNVFNEFNPSILPDGRIIYDRWEYNERSVTSVHKLFTSNPDGTGVAPYYGNATIRPNVIMFPRAVPGSSKVMALFTAHHGQTHGPVGLIDVRRGVDGAEPVTLLTPGVPVTGEKAEDSRFGWFSDPVPLSETTYLCSYTPTVLPWLERSWALYVGDRHGNLALVYRDPEISCAEPVPLIARPRPPVLAVASSGSDKPEDPQAQFLLMDVYRGLSGVKPGEAKFLRILEDVPRQGVPEGGVIVTAATKTYTVKRILGTVPIQPDGSAHFEVPADRNVYFEVLDEKHREIQRMRSVVTLKPGEVRTCIGCHESRRTAPPNLAFDSPRQAPSRPVPPPWGKQTFSFLRDVQPVINAKCAGCHTFDRAANGVILTDDLTDQFTVAYEELVPFVSAANAMRWDNPDDVYPQPSYTFGSKVSPLTKLLEKGHHGVQLNEDEWRRLFVWMDANAVYYDRYESVYPYRKIVSDALKRPLKAVYERRCGRCHGQDNEGQQDSWWLSLNRRDFRQSRALQAPLARAAGGWERCDEVVFASDKDADYQALLAGLIAIRDRLTERPREDLLSIHGTEAERQKIAPVVPPTKAAGTAPQPADGAVFLSDLPWSFARSGWSPNQDGLPRRDRDIENKPLRLGQQTYRKGIGTHAPSEIRFDIRPGFDRFRAVIGGAEANGTVVFQVFGDARKLFDSGTLRGKQDAKMVDFSVSGVKELRLLVTDAGDGYFCDEANWASARLSRNGKTASRN